jgi:hypothetical protein
LRELLLLLLADVLTHVPPGSSLTLDRIDLDAVPKHRLFVQLISSPTPRMRSTLLAHFVLTQNVVVNNAPLLELPDPQVLPGFPSQGLKEPVQVRSAALHKPQVALSRGLPR